MPDLVPPKRPEDFPLEVHESLRQLRQIARQATSKDDPTLRRATADEVALSELLRKPQHCSGHSSRTGLACQGSHKLGMGVCRRHGGSLRVTKAAARRKLAQLTPGLLESQAWLAYQRDHIPAAVNATKDLLDRAGVGALVQAKVRASKQQQQGNGTQVVVNIGFLG